MSTLIPSTDVPNTSASQYLVMVNMANVTKLSSTNYLTWSAQVRSLLSGYDLIKFIDESSTIPPQTIAGSENSNPAFVAWQRQDCLIYSTLMGSIELAHQSLIVTTTSSLDAWKILANTYNKPTRGHIK